MVSTTIFAVVLAVIIITNVVAIGIIYDKSNDKKEPPVVVIVNNTQPQPPVSNDTEPQPIPTPTPQPQPQPQPVIKDIRAIVVGDVYDSTSGKLVFEQIKKQQNIDYYFILGDLGYGHWKWFVDSYGSLGDKMWCVIGNHEADNEDGNTELQKAALDYCGNSYWLKYYSTLFLMLNTNDNQNTLTAAVGKVLDNSTIMSGVKNIHVNGHKGCATPPNSHHPAGEIKVLCNYLNSEIPNGIKVWYNSAHNHVYSESQEKTFKQSGAGGKSHYTCGTNTAFPYCNNTSYGFLLYDIKANGTTTSQFIDYNGVVKH